MRSFIITSALLVSVVLATPAIKRDIVTKVHTDYVTEVVTVGAAAPTPEPVVYVHRQHRQQHRTYTTTVIVGASPEPVPEPEQKAPEAEPTPEPIPAPVVDKPEDQAPSPSPEPLSIPQTFGQAVVPTAAPEPAPSPSAIQNPTSGGGSTPYQQACLNHHNQHRANHSAPALVWDTGLENAAREVAQSCQFKHNTVAGGGGYGQNIAARWPGGVSGSEIAKVISDQFYNNEIELYPGYGGEPDMSNFHAWGHFSQVIWVDTTHVACYTQNCAGTKLGGHFTVCNYKSPGNFGGRYAKNVLPPKNAPILHG